MNILAVDVAYQQDRAVAAGVLFQAWEAADPLQEFTLRCAPAEAYVPGKFYRRELPCLLQLLQRVGHDIDIIIIDGFVYLGADHKPGLGSYLFESLDRQVAVIGVAKSAFKETPASTALLRGNSQRPLYVTAIGIAEETARQGIRQMYGKSRLPALLQRVDHLCRKFA